jgi:hypothetical protein
MIARVHQTKHVSELLEIDALLTLERVLREEWNDVFHQVSMVPHSIGHPIAVIPTNHSATEVGLDRVQELHIAFVLDDGEFRKNLNANLHVRMSGDTNMKASFTIHEACNPFRAEIHGHPERKVSEGSLCHQGLPCGLSPCPSVFYCSRVANEYRTAV